MTVFQMLVKQKPRKVTQGRSNLPLEILRSFQAERQAGQRVNQAVERRLLEVIQQPTKGE